MALEPAVDATTASIVSIGLSKSNVVGGEVTGGGYTPQAPTYAAAANGSADLTGTLHFTGPANDGPVTHLIYRTAAGVLRVQALAASVSFNSDGLLDVTSAPVTAAFGS